MMGFQVLNNATTYLHHIQTLSDKNVSLSFLQRGQFVIDTTENE